MNPFAIEAGPAVYQFCIFWGLITIKDIRNSSPLIRGHSIYGEVIHKDIRTL